MAKNKTENIKNEIIAMATQLFFEQGYDDTTFSDIAKRLNTSKGHINYYFNTKDEIGAIVYTNFVTRIRQVIHDKLAEKFGGYDSATAMAIGFRLENEMFREYPNSFRFSFEAWQGI